MGTPGQSRVLAESEIYKTTIMRLIAVFSLCLLLSVAFASSPERREAVADQVDDAMLDMRDAEVERREAVADQVDDAMLDMRDAEVEKRITPLIKVAAKFGLAGAVGAAFEKAFEWIGDQITGDRNNWNHDHPCPAGASRSNIVSRHEVEICDGLGKNLQCGNHQCVDVTDARWELKSKHFRCPATQGKGSVPVSVGRGITESCSHILATYFHV